MQHPLPLLIDTDCGVDDALALAFAFRSPELSVEFITTVAGNVGVSHCTRNVLRIVRLLQPATPPVIARGAKRPLKKKLLTAPEVHGVDGFGGTTIRGTRFLPASLRVGRNAVKTILDACRQHGSRLTIVAVGPLTNLALAVKSNRRLLARAGRIITMGGAMRVPGNTGPVAEFNYFVDPEAADIVLNAGLPVTVIPLDVTEQCVLLARDLRDVAVRTGSRLARAMVAVTRSYMKYHVRTEGFDGGYLHDPLAVAAVVDPGLLTTLPAQIRVECESPLTRGMTVATFSYGTRSSVFPRVAVGVDQARFKRLFLERIV